MSLKQDMIKAVFCGLVICITGWLISGCNQGEPMVPSTPSPPPDPPPAGAAAPAVTTEHQEPEWGPSELYADWDSPLGVLVFTGRQNGYVEPCGCTGLDRQKGGLARRHTFLQGIKERGWPVMGLDIGNQVRRYGRQPELKFNLTVQLLELMGYQAIALGPNDLKLPAGELFAVSAVDEDGQSMFVSANTAVLDRSFIPRLQIVKLGEKKIGITSIVSDQWNAQIFSEDLILESVEQGLMVTLEQMKTSGCDLHVLLVHDSIKASRVLAAKFPQFHIVVSAGSGGDPPYEMEQVEKTQTHLVEVGVKGMYASVVGLFPGKDGDFSFRYQRVPLDSTYQDSKQVLSRFKQYQEELQRTGLQGLGIQAIPHPSGSSFVGSAACAACHQSAYDQWQESSHAHATQSLIQPPERPEITRQFDPECLSCHTTGWQPREFVPYQTGFSSMKASSHLAGSGCENCHGPGSEHVRLEGLEDLHEVASLMEARQKMKLTLATAKDNQCMTCHDLDNSPDFHVPGAFQEYWERIAH